MTNQTGIIPEADSQSTAGSGPRNPTCPSASIAMEANVALSDLTTSSRQLTVLTSSGSETCTKVNLIVLLNKENVYIGKGKKSQKSIFLRNATIDKKKRRNFQSSAISLTQQKTIYCNCPQQKIKDKLQE